MAMTPEGKVKQKLDKMLKSLDLWSFPPQAGPFGSAGIPDRIVCICGLFVGIEAKADKTKKPTALQDKCMRDIVAAGGVCFVVFDDDSIDFVRSFLTGILLAKCDYPTIGGMQ